MRAAKSLPTDWPRAWDDGAADRLLERIAAADPAGARLSRTPAGLALIRGLGGNSPYLADLALREVRTLARIASGGPGPIVAAALAEIAALPPTLGHGRLAASLRAAKRQVALATAVADIGGLWTLDRITAALSDLAEAALHASVRHLLRAGHAAGELRLPDPADPERGSGFVVLGMGKLGARELNYSSDIDLVLLHDPDSGAYVGQGAGAFFTRLSRGLVTLMELRDADGYVFRTDLRLRPDPAATPPSITFQAAVAYYESMGQNWERAAMLKARAVAGDASLGAAFLEAIRPFIWRRHLDFAAMADIHAMKRRIDAHKGTALGAQADQVRRIAGHNVKLGAGGIREIEFLAQTLQLVWGGRDPSLRVPQTLKALRLLAGAGHIPRRAAAELASAYRFLRQVEHRLQMVADRQVHTLPERPEQLTAFATFMGATDAPAFATTLLRHLTRVQTRYEALFEDVPADEDGALAHLDFRGTGDLVPETAAALTGMGYRDHERVTSAVRAWLSGRVRALRSLRARELMETVLPTLLAALGQQDDPDAAFRRFDSFLNRLPAGVQLLSLFQRNPALLERVASVLGAAPFLADHLASTPSALEGLTSPDVPGNPARVLRTRLTDGRSLEEALAIIRATVREEDFRLSVATMERRIDADEAGLLRTALADAALPALFERVLEDFAARNGTVSGGGMALVALGKTGGREMMAGSDLDLMFIYDHPANVIESTGARKLAASQWFIRAVHAIVAAITAPDAEGPTYQIDMRLRPSGNKGPVAVSLQSFIRYHAEDAWTWERMALTRARVVAGRPALRSRIASEIRRAIAAAGSAEKVREDAAAMRARMLRDLPPAGRWDVKLRPGGQIEVEFIVQVLQLIHPDCGNTTTRLALAALRDAGALAADEAALLIRADLVWRTVQGILRITSGRTPPEHLPQAAADILRAVSGAALGGPAPPDIETLRAGLDTLATDVRGAFERHVGRLTGAARREPKRA
jgi:glutamate-ammonia-ligase adenylyltransferase